MKATSASLAVLTALLTADLHAESSGTSTLSLGAITVTPKDNGPLLTDSILTSVDIMGSDKIEDKNVMNSWELVGQMPGIQLTETRQGAESGKASFRAFNGEGYINGIKILIDGIPSNDNAGGMPYLDAVFPQDISALEIVRGTNDARYGLHAIAGDVNVLTRQGGNDGQASLTVGSFGTRDVQIAKGFEKGAWAQNYFVGWRTSDGERDHANGTQRSFAGKWFYTNEEGQWRAGLSTRYYKNTALEAGYLSYAEVQANPTQSPDYARDDRSERQTMQTALHADGQLGNGWSWNAKAYQNDYRNQRWVTFTAGGAQQERFNDETHRGVILNTTWRPSTALAELVEEFDLLGDWEGRIEYVIDLGKDLAQQGVDVDLNAAHTLVKLVTPGMIAQRWGRLILVTSIVADLAVPGAVSYVAAKGEGLVPTAKHCCRWFRRSRLWSYSSSATRAMP